MVHKANKHKAFRDEPFNEGYEQFMKQREFREKMPWCASIIDDLVREFGQEFVHGQIRQGLAGRPTFWAQENGHEIGTRDTVPTSAISWDAVGNVISVVPHWMIEARKKAAACGIAIPQAESSDQFAMEREAEELRKVLAMPAKQ